MTRMRKLGGAIVALLSAGLGFFAGHSSSAVGKEPRFPQLTMAQLTDEQRAASGAGPDVIRLSIGLESAEDLIRDLDEALGA